MDIYYISLDGIHYHLLPNGLPQNKLIILGPGWSFVYSGLSPAWFISLKATENDEVFRMWIELINGWVFTLSYRCSDRWTYLNISLILGTFQIIIVLVSVLIGSKCLRFRAMLLSHWCIDVVRRLISRFQTKALFFLSICNDAADFRGVNHTYRAVSRYIND